MAKLPNLGSFNLKNSTRDNYLKLEGENNEALLVTKTEVRDVLNEYINSQLSLHTLDVTREHKLQIEKNIKVMFDGFVDQMTKLVNDRMNTVTGEIINKLISAHINEEIEKRVDEKLNKIKNSL